MKQQLNLNLLRRPYQCVTLLNPSFFSRLCYHSGLHYPACCMTYTARYVVASQSIQFIAVLPPYTLHAQRTPYIGGGTYHTQFMWAGGNPISTPPAQDTGQRLYCHIQGSEFSSKTQPGHVLLHIIALIIVNHRNHNAYRGRCDTMHS